MENRICILLIIISLFLVSCGSHHGYSQTADISFDGVEIKILEHALIPPGIFQSTFKNGSHEYFRIRLSGSPSERFMGSDIFSVMEVYGPSDAYGNSICYQERPLFLSQWNKDVIVEDNLIVDAVFTCLNGPSKRVVFKTSKNNLYAQVGDKWDLNPGGLSEEAKTLFSSVQVEDNKKQAALEEQQRKQQEQNAQEQRMIDETQKNYTVRYDKCVTDGESLKPCLASARKDLEEEYQQENAYGAGDNFNIEKKMAPAEKRCKQWEESDCRNAALKAVCSNNDLCAYIKK